MNSPFVFMLFGLITLLLAIQGGENIVTSTVNAVASANATSWGTFLAFVLQFIPVLYYVGTMTLAGGLGAYGASSLGNPLASVIFGIILVSIGVQSIPTVISSIDSAITAAAGISFLEFMLPFVVVMYGVSILGVAIVIGAIALRDLRGRKTISG